MNSLRCLRAAGTLVLLLFMVGNAAHAQDPTTRRYVKWDRLSNEIIPKVIESNGDFGSAVKHFRKAACTLELSITFSVSPNPVGGTFRFSWNDKNDNGILTEDEIDIEVEHLTNWNLGYFMRELRESMKKELATTTFNIFTLCNTKTKRTENGYLMELRPSSQVRISKYMALEKLYITVDENFRATHLQTRTVEGIEIAADLKHTRLGEFTLKSGVRQRTETPNGNVTLEDRTDTYALVQGIPLPSRIISDSQITVVNGTTSIRSDVSFENWIVTKRDKPVPTPGTQDYEEMFRNVQDVERPLIEVEGEAPPTPDRPVDPPRPEDRPGGGGGLFEDDPPAGDDGGGLFEDPPAGNDGGGLFEDDPPRGPTEAEKKLGQQVLRKVSETSYGWHRYPGKRYAAKCLLGETPETAVAEWVVNSTDAAGVTREHRTLDPNASSALLSEVKASWYLVMAGPLWRLGAPPATFFAKRTAGGFLLTGLDAAGQTVEEVKLGEDYSVKERFMLMRPPESSAPIRQVITFEVGSAGGLNYISRATIEEQPGAGRRSYRYTYRHVNGIPFLKRIAIEAERNGNRVAGQIHVIAVDIE